MSMSQRIRPINECVFGVGGFVISKTNAQPGMLFCYINCGLPVCQTFHNGIIFITDNNASHIGKTGEFLGEIG